MEVCTKYDGSLYKVQIMPDYTLMVTVSYYIIGNKCALRGRDGYTWVIVSCLKIWGEAWEIEENYFLLHPDMWYQSVANYVAWYRDREPKMQKESMNLVYCYHDGRYCGAIAVSDGLIQWTIHEPKKSIAGKKG